MKRPPRRERARAKAWAYLALFGADEPDDEVFGADEPDDEDRTAGQ